MLVVAALIVTVLGFASGQSTSTSTSSYDNCMSLGGDRLQVAWTVNRQEEMVDFLLCGCAQDESVSDGDVYVAFGLSGSTNQTRMLGADVTVAWIDRAGRANAQDYSLSSYIQCVQGVGACPDTLDRRGCTNDVWVTAGTRIQTKQCIAFSRKFNSSDTACDLPIDPDEMNQYIVWGVGGLGDTAFKHFARATMADDPVHLGRTPSNNCSAPLVCPDCRPFSEKVIDVRDENTTFIVNIGPTGLDRGYMAIAGQAGWGNSIYLNGTLIPHLKVRRGRTYTFICEVGNNPDPFVPGGGNYHPFYITDSKTGGWLSKSEAERSRETIYAGFDGVTPLGIGPYCEYTESPAAGNALGNCGTFDEYLEGLDKEACRSNDAPGVYSWTPKEDTPETVYYQCATHRNFGFKISVDSGCNRLVPSLAAIIILKVLVLLLGL